MINISKKNPKNPIKSFEVFIMQIPLRKDLTKKDWISAERWFNSLNPQAQLENIMDLYFNKIMLKKSSKHPYFITVCYYKRCVHNIKNICQLRIRIGECGLWKVSPE